MLKRIENFRRMVVYSSEEDNAEVNEQRSDLELELLVKPKCKLNTPSEYTSKIFMEVVSPKTRKAGYTKRTDIDQKKLKTIYRAVGKKFPTFSTKQCNFVISQKLAHLRELDTKKRRETVKPFT